MSGSGISWAICKSAPCSRQITTPASERSVFLQVGCPSCRPTNSVKALKASSKKSKHRQSTEGNIKFNTLKNFLKVVFRISFVCYIVFTLVCLFAFFVYSSSKIFWVYSCLFWDKFCFVLLTGVFLLQNEKCYKWTWKWLTAVVCNVAEPLWHAWWRTLWVNTLLHLYIHTYTHLTALFPGLLGSAGTRKVKPIWILLKQETVSGIGISWAICKSASRSRQITMPVPHHS